MTTDAVEARRGLRRMLPEFCAVIEEYRSGYTSRQGRPRNPGEIPLTYGEELLAIVSPLLVSYATAVRRPEYIDEIPDEEVLAVHAVIAPVLELRRQRRALYERRHGGGQ